MQHGRERLGHAWATPTRRPARNVLLPRGGSGPASQHLLRVGGRRVSPTPVPSAPGKREGDRIRGDGGGHHAKRVTHLVLSLGAPCCASPCHWTGVRVQIQLGGGRRSWEGVLTISFSRTDSRKRPVAWLGARRGAGRSWHTQSGPPSLGPGDLGSSRAPESWLCGQQFSCFLPGQSGEVGGWGCRPATSSGSSPWLGLSPAWAARALRHVPGLPPTAQPRVSQGRAGTPGPGSSFGHLRQGQRECRPSHCTVLLESKARGRGGAAGSAQGERPPLWASLRAPRHTERVLDAPRQRPEHGVTLC